MIDKFIFTFVRGFDLFTRYLRGNLLSACALIALFTILHTVFALAGSASYFANTAASFDKLRVYISGTSLPADTVNQFRSMNAVIGVKLYGSEDTKALIIENAPSISGLNTLSSEFFPVFYELSIAQEHRTIEGLQALSADISTFSGVESVSYGGEWAERISGGKKALSGILLVCSVFFALAGVVLIYQTINISMHRYRTEIRIYSVVGGTTGFIVAPFVVVAALLAGLTALISAACYLLIRLAFLAKLGAVLGLSLSLGTNYFLIFSLAAIGTGLLAGFISALMFLKKAYYINETNN